jgi:NitT/TauT family transport system ATP-binding protein
MAGGSVKIRLDHVSVVFRHGGREVTAVQDVSLDVFEGEFLCVVGPSGCGKSTLLNVLLGVLAPTEGAAYVDGRRVTGPGAERACVFQEYALFPWMTVIENVAFGLESRGVRREEREALARQIVEGLGLGGHAQAYPHTLSGGMKQRVSIARALAVNPDILLMDEPLAAVDALTRTKLQYELLAIWNALRKTVVLITHSIDEACFLADRIVVMTPPPGRIQEVFACDLPRPRTLSDAGFVTLLSEVRASLERDREPPRGADYGRIAQVLGTRP